MKVNATQTSLPQLLRKRRSGRIALTLALLLLPISASGQGITSSTARRVRGGNTPPATCRATAPADVWIDTDAAAGQRLLVCSSTNTWTAQGGSGSVTTSGSPTAGNLAKFSSATAITPATATDVSTPVQCADAGASDTYACNLAPAPASYVVGTHLRFFANTANTGAASINFNSLGALTLVKAAGGITTGLSDNDIRAGQWVDCVVATGSNCQVQSTLGNAGGGGVTNSAGNNVLMKSDGTNAVPSSLTDDGSKVTATLPFRVPDGSAAAPSYAIASEPSTGIYTSGTGDISITNSGARNHAFQASTYYLLSNTASIQLGAGQDAIYSRGGAGIHRFGTTAANAAGRVNFTTGLIEPLTVATLPAGTAGMYAYVTDGDASLAWGATVVNSGAGATKYLVWFSGTNWTVVGK